MIQNASAQLSQRPARRWPRTLLFLQLSILNLQLWSASAASHPEVTVTPLPPTSIALTNREGKRLGKQTKYYQAPTDALGRIVQALVLTAAQPWMDAPIQPPAKDDGGDKPQMQTPATMNFIVSGKRLPPWTLRPGVTAYVINLETLRANPKAAIGWVELELEIETKADGIGINMLGMPDPMLAGVSVDGPLEEIGVHVKDEEVRSHLAAMALEVSGKLEEARTQYESLRDAKNAEVGRLARRALRQLSYQLRKRKLSGFFDEHYHWGLYLGECGLFNAAAEEFDECRVLNPKNGEAQFRAGEMRQRTGMPTWRVMDYMTRAGQADGVTDPIQWRMLVAILKARTYRVEGPGGGETKSKALSADDLRQLQDSWIYAESMIWGATGGRIQLVTSFFEINDDAVQQYVRYGDPHSGVWGPKDIVEERGWFDGVISVRPAAPGEIVVCGRQALPMVGSDAGPNGASLTDVLYDPAFDSWPDLVTAWYQQFRWAATVGEAGGGCWIPRDAADSGDFTAPSNGHAVRAALREEVTQGMYRAVKSAALPSDEPGQYLKLWRIEGPFPIKGAAGDASPPARHGLEKRVDESAVKVQFVESKLGVVDLKKLLPGLAPALARATCWVYSPTDQRIRMWLGRNDGAAVWLNGRLVHEGGAYSGGLYEDRNVADTVATGVDLAKGWNELLVVVEASPAPRDKAWGFSVRLCDWNDAPLPGLASTHKPPPANELVPRYAAPEAGPYYSWMQSRDNYHDDLPRLSEAHLQRITGLNDLKLKSQYLETGEGFIAIQTGEAKERRGYRAAPSAWRAEEDRDFTLNNLLDWARESCAVVRYTKDGKSRDLLLLKIGAADAFLQTLVERADAKAIFGDRSPANRLLGYVVLPAKLGGRPLLVVDTAIGDGSGWPIDEEDLLTPQIEDPALKHLQEQAAGTKVEN